MRNPELYYTHATVNWKTLLLKKVEELTLYLIEKDKNDMKQQNEINELKKRLDRVVEAKKD